MERKQPVLVIDRDEAVREAMELVLADEGYAVWAVASSAAGLAMLLASSHPMVVLFDVVPQQHLAHEANGVALVDAVRQEPTALRHHAYIMMTTAPELATELAGTVPPPLTIPVLRKPFDLSELLRTVAEAVYLADESRAYTAAC